MRRQLDEINERRFQKVMDKFMVKVLWYPSILCSCISNNNGVRNPRCACINGYFYQEPIEVEIVRTQPKNRNVFHHSGVFVQGEAKFSIPKYKYKNGIREELAICNQISRGDVLVISAYSHTDIDVLMKDVRDEIWTFNIEAVLVISQTTMDAAGVSTNRVFQEGIDYSYVENRIIWHTTGNKPEPETPYTVKFQSKQQYIVREDVGMQRGVEDQQLGRVLTCPIRPYGMNAVNPIDGLTFKDNTFSPETTLSIYDESQFDLSQFTT